MSHEDRQPGSPRDWMARARSNLTRAGQPKPPDVFWEDVCFDAQQAAEKALKALLLHRNIPFRLVHDIGELLMNLQKNGVVVPEEILAAAALTEFAVEARYPGPFEPVTAREAEEAIQLATVLFRWVESQFN